MKKLIALLTLATLSLTLAACSNATTTKSQATTTTNSQATTTVEQATTTVGQATTVAPTTTQQANNLTLKVVNPANVDVSGITFVTPGKLTVSMSTDFAPYEFIDLTKNGQEKYVGSDVELAKLIAASFGLELEIKAMDFDSTLIALDNDIADIAISGFSYTVERAASYLYTDCYFSDGDGGQVVVVKKGNESTYTTIESMNKAGLKIAAQNGALQQTLVKQFMPNATLVEIDDLNSTYDALFAGSVDGVAVAANVAQTLVDAQPEKFAIVQEAFDFDDSGSFCLVKLGNTALANAINQVLSQCMNDETYQAWSDYYSAVFANLGDKAGELIPEEE